MREKILKIAPPIWLFIFLVLGLGAHFLIPSSRVFDISSPVIGAVALVAGLLLSIWTARMFREEGTEIEPTSLSNKSLITRGPYTLSRNPMYLGGLAALIGVAIWIGTLPLFLAALAQFLILNFVFVPFEEAKMARQFGDRYETFKSRVRRWV